MLRMRKITSQTGDGKDYKEDYDHLLPIGQYVNLKTR